MTVDEAFVEMKKRGWGYTWIGHMIGIGPITNPGYEAKKEPPLINVLAVDEDQIVAVQKAIEASKQDENESI